MLPPWDAVKDQSKIDDFTQKTGIKVNLEIVGWDQIHDKVTIATATKAAAADVVEVDWSWVGEFAKIGAVDPLNVTEADKKDIPDLALFTIDGKIYAMPYLNDFRMLAYNKAQFDKAGITAPPATWDDLIADAATLKAKGITKYPLGLPLSVSGGTTTAFLTLGISRAGSLFDEKNDVKRDNVLSTLQFIDKAINVDHVIDPAASSLIDGEINQNFQSGNSSFILSSAGGLVNFDDPSQSKIVGQADLTLIPGNADRATASLALPGAMGISTFSKNKESAQKVVDWLLSDAMQNYYFESQGALPTRISVLDAIQSAGKLNNADVVQQQAQNIVAPFPAGIPTWYPQFDQAVANAISEMANGALTPEAATDAIVTKVADLQKAQ